MYHWNSFLFQRNLNTHFWVFIKLKFLGILNSSQSFEEQVMTCSNCIYTIWEKKLDAALREFISIFIFIYLSFTRFMTSYTMRRTCVPRKVRRSPKLRGLWRSPELFYEEYGLSYTRNSPTESTCGNGKLLFASF